jgi:Ulp1 family protease
MDFYRAVATKEEPTYPDVVLAKKSPPWDGPFPYSSSQDPSLVLPLFYLEVSPEDWDRYERWWRSAVGLDGSKVLVRFGTNQVLIQDAVTLRPAEWLADNILHYFTHSVERIFKIKNSVLVFFSSYFLTLLFNEGHSNPDLEISSATNVATWWSEKRTRLKTSLQEVKTLVFFRNEGRMHWVTYIIFQDLKIIEEFGSMGSSDTNILKGLYRWLFIEYQRIGIHLDSKKWRLYQTRQSTPRQRNGYITTVGFFHPCCSPRRTLSRPQ